MQETSESLRGLSGQEVTALASQIADTTRAGLPLHSGLQALSQEVSSRRLRSTLKRLADALERGTTLEAALTAEGARIPLHLQNLVRAGSKTGKIGEVLGNFAAYSDVGTDLRRSLGLRLIYPVFSIIFGMAIFVFVSIVMLGGFEQIFKDFGVPLPLLTQLLISVGRTVSRVWWPIVQGLTGLGAVWLVLHALVPSKYRSILFSFIPFLGRVDHLTSLAEFCHLLALLLESEVSLDKALPAAGEGVKDVRIATMSALVAADVTSGQPLAESLRRRSLFPHGFSKILGWAEEHRGLPEALHMAGEMFFAKARAQAEFVATLSSALAVLSILSGVTVTVIGLMAPMLSLIRSLTG